MPPQSLVRPLSPDDLGLGVDGSLARWQTRKWKRASVCRVLNGVLGGNASFALVSGCFCVAQPPGLTVG